jgi:hypothetical protein
MNGLQLASLKMGIDDAEPQGKQGNEKKKNRACTTKWFYEPACEQHHRGNKW